jgi:cell wall assembly regulator SMI1
MATRKKSGGDDVRANWARVERWFAQHRPDLALNLRPGATEKAIAAAEKQLGVELPADFRSSLLVHDGQDDWPGVQLFPVAHRLGAVASLARCWKDDRGVFDAKEMKTRFDSLDDSKRVRQVHFHPKHVPIAGSKFWDYGRLLLDFIPGPEGQLGQVIARDDVDFVFVCASFGELLAKTASGLEAGAVVVVPGADRHELQYRRGKKKVSAQAFFD